MKICTGCKADKELHEFNSDRSKKDGKCTRCRSCMSISQRDRLKLPEIRERNRRVSKAWRAANPDKSRRGIRCATLRKKYGISAEQFDSMFLAQGEACAICSGKESKGYGQFHVDH